MRIHMWISLVDDSRNGGNIHICSIFEGFSKNDRTRSLTALYSVGMNDGLYRLYIYRGESAYRLLVAYSGRETTPIRMVSDPGENRKS
jgi:hypothetical protein